MIRMGRSSRSEQSTSNTTSENYQTQTSGSGSSYQYQNETLVSSNRAASESDSIARDIKEGRLSGFVGHGTVLTGETHFQSILRIDGHLTGQVTSENGTLIVGSTGQVDANIMVAAAVINGTVNGDIIASEKIELGRSAHVVGNIQTPRLKMEDGAVLEGSCAMIKAREMAEKQKAGLQTQTASQEYAAYRETDDDEDADIAAYDETEDADEAAVS